MEKSTIKAIRDKESLDWKNIEGEKFFQLQIFLLKNQELLFGNSCELEEERSYFNIPEDLMMTGKISLLKIILKQRNPLKY